MNVDKILAAALLVTLAFTASSCRTSNDRDCGGHDREKLVAFNAITPSEFIRYTTAQPAGLVTYQSFYNVNGGKAGFSFMITIDKACPYEGASSYSTLVLNHADPALIDTISIQGTGGNLVKDAVTPSNGTVYDFDQLYTFPDNAPSEVSITMINRLLFPTQGSWAADSAYFFSNLNSLYIGGKYKLPQF